MPSTATRPVTTPHLWRWLVDTPAAGDLLYRLVTGCVLTAINIDLIVSGDASLPVVVVAIIVAIAAAACAVSAAGSLIRAYWHRGDSTQTGPMAVVDAAGVTHASAVPLDAAQRARIGGLLGELDHIARERNATPPGARGQQALDQVERDCWDHIAEAATTHPSNR